MSKYVIITDAASDLSKEYRNRYDIDYVRMSYSFTDEKGLHEYPTTLDWEDLSQKEFYDLLRNGTRIFTSQVSMTEYMERFEKHLKQGLDVLYIACSSGLSA